MSSNQPSQINSTLPAVTPIAPSGNNSYVAASSKYTFQAIEYPTEIGEAAMLKMTVEEIQDYYNAFSTSVGIDYVELHKYDDVQADLERKILRSESTITGLDTEIGTNDAILKASRAHKSTLDRQISEFDDKISTFTSTIEGFDTQISSTNGTISSLTLEAKGIDKMLFKSDEQFTSSAKVYSTLFLEYLSKEAIYQRRVNDIINESTLLKANMIVESTSAYAYKIARNIRIKKDEELSTLYGESNFIQTSLTQYRIDEQAAITNLTSTNLGIISISSLYETAVHTRDYYDAVDRQSKTIESHYQSVSTLAEVDRLVADYPSNKTYQAAQSMTRQSVANLAREKGILTQEVDTLKQNVIGAQQFSYEALLTQYQSSIQGETDAISTFSMFRKKAESDVAAYSSIYDQAILDVISSIRVVSSYSTLYESSISGASTLLRIAQLESNDIIETQGKIDTLTFVIASLSNDIINYSSSFNSYSTISSLKTQEYLTEMSNMMIYSSFYESTNSSIQQFNDQLISVNKTILTNNGIVSYQTDRIDREATNIKAYHAVVADCVRSQEFAAYEYRETCVRTKRLAANELYNANVVKEVQNTSTMNGNARAAAGTGVVINAIPVNLNTPDISGALTTVNTISNFLNSFSEIYDTYTIQSTNYQSVSTSIANEKASLLVLQALKGDPTIPPDEITRAMADLRSRELEFSSFNTNMNLTDVQILNLKENVNKLYTTIMRADEIIAAETAISSFLMQGISSAVTI